VHDLGPNFELVSDVLSSNSQIKVCHSHLVLEIVDGGTCCVLCTLVAVSAASLYMSHFHEAAGVGIELL